MPYTYPFPRGWATFAHKELSPIATSIVSSLSETCDGSAHYEVDESIDALQVWKRVPVVNSYRRFGQQYRMLVKEITSEFDASHTASYSAYLDFCAFPQTLDEATDLERPFAVLTPAYWVAGGTQSLTLTHTSDFDGPSIAIEWWDSDCWDPIADESFVAKYDGLLTSILFGWYYSGTSGATLEGSVTIAGVDLFTQPTEYFGD